VVICLERGTHLHTAQLIPLPHTFSCFSKFQIGFTFLVSAQLGSPRKRAFKCVCVCVCACVQCGAVRCDALTEHNISGYGWRWKDGKKLVWGWVDMNHR